MGSTWVSSIVTNKGVGEEIALGILCCLRRMSDQIFCIQVHKYILVYVLIIAFWPKWCTMNQLASILGIKDIL